MIVRRAQVGALSLASIVSALIGLGIATPSGRGNDLTFRGGVLSAPHGKPAVSGPGGYYLTADEVAQIRQNIVTRPQVKQAWANAKAFADSKLAVEPKAADPNGDYSRYPPERPNWRDDLYIPGIEDGHAAAGLALAWLVTKDARYARSAKRILFGWVQRYTHPPGVGGGSAPGHMVAEPIGPMIKFFITADMLRSYLSTSERQRVSVWARQWIAVGERSADYARDNPWVPALQIGSFESSEASYGNSAFGQRAMAMWAAAIAGPRYLANALAWNWQHTTAAGREYGWLDVIDHFIIPGTGGETIEGRERKSVGYGLFGWGDLVLIADLAKHAGYERNLFTTPTPTGKNVLSVGPFYGPLLAGSAGYPYASSETFLDYETQTKPEYRAVFETAYKNCPTKNPVCSYFRSAVRAGGPIQRGNNEDFHLMRWNALTSGIQLRLPAPVGKG